ncbi:hypothetical protein EC973_004482 [Apophysomyces ossiformis]|uniref:Uncharacterized protein n=1 Tax=Apophysomyces ossiformis TaxID=679940 RepID=A0A8H7BEL9_9FUNG|nr:hypothetical protein EC973_004482 [Apophysomyces ossiformis]
MQDPSHQRDASASLESPERKEIFRLGSKNIDIVSLHLDSYRTVRRYDLCLDIAKRRENPNVEVGIVNEFKQPLVTGMDTKA